MEHSNDFPDAFYRVTIKGLCVRDDKLLMIREAESEGGIWELPGGGLDFGEDIYIGFNRETQEEMGLNVAKMSRTPMYVWTHKYTNRRSVEWFYSLVLAYRVEFESLDFTPTKECEEIRFVSKEEMKILPLGGQMQELPGIFNLEDFRERF